LGVIIPEMGTISSKLRAGLADALFTPVQQRVLGLLPKAGGPAAAPPEGESAARFDR
jgi:hypothetical protein